MPVKIFFCYAHEDEALLNKLKAHLRPLQRQGLIEVWYDRDINAGTAWEQEISKHLYTADMILLLISPDFMDSDYCYSIEMQRAIERHDRRETRVIPVILRPVYWQGILGNLQALPKDAKPVKSWADLDEAFFDVAEGIRKEIGTIPLHPPRLRKNPSLQSKMSPPPMESIPVKKERIPRVMNEIEDEIKDNTQLLSLSSSLPNASGGTRTTRANRTSTNIENKGNRSLSFIDNKSNRVQTSAFLIFFVLLTILIISFYISTVVPNNSVIQGISVLIGIATGVLIYSMAYLNRSTLKNWYDHIIDFLRFVK